MTPVILRPLRQAQDEREGAAAFSRRAGSLTAMEPRLWR